MIGTYYFLEKLTPRFINNMRHRKPLPVCGKEKYVRDWLYGEDHIHAFDLIFHNGKITETYNIGGINEQENIDIIKVVIKTVDHLFRNSEEYSLELITYVTDRKGHGMCYAIDSRKLWQELDREPSLQFEEGITKIVHGYLYSDKQKWMIASPLGDTRNVLLMSYQRKYAIKFF